MRWKTAAEPLCQHARAVVRSIEVNHRQTSFRAYVPPLLHAALLGNQGFRGRHMHVLVKKARDLAIKSRKRRRPRHGRGRGGCCARGRSLLLNIPVPFSCSCRALLIMAFLIGCIAL